MSTHDDEAGLLPRLRFPEFQGRRDWDQAQLADMITTISPPKKLQTSQYRAEIATLDFYGDTRFRRVWVAPSTAVMEEAA